MTGPRSATRLQGFASARAFFSEGAPPMKHDQFTLPFLDTTSLGGGLGLYGGFPTARSPALPEMTFEPEAAEVVDTPDPRKSTVPAHAYRLAGDRLSPRA